MINDDTFDIFQSEMLEVHSFGALAIALHDGKFFAAGLFVSSRRGQRSDAEFGLIVKAGEGTIARKRKRRGKKAQSERLRSAGL